MGGPPQEHFFLMVYDDTKSRPKTPADVARELRQEAGFGCCRCGKPILEYHHIIPWAVEPHFRREDMMVLCPNHHREFGSAMPEAEQRTYKSRPYNIQHGLAGGLLRVNQDYCAIDLGSVTVVNQGPILSIDGEVLLALRVDEGMLKLSLTVYDRDDRLLVVIADNEWLSGDPLPWDIEASFQRLTLRERARMINLDLDARSIPPFLAAELWKSGKSWKVTKNGISASADGGDKPLGGVEELALVGGALAVNSKGFTMGSSDGSYIVSWPNRRERLWKAKNAWHQLQRKRREA